MSFLQIPPSDDTSRTQQHFKNDCDINQVVKRYFKTGVLETVTGNPRNTPKFGDFSTKLDYQEALNTVRNAEQQFLSLNSRVRKRFKNNPHEFVKFMENPENLEEAIQLGLAEKIEPKAKAPSSPIEGEKT